MEKYIAELKEPLTELVVKSETVKTISASHINCDNFMVTGNVITLYDKEKLVIACIPVDNLKGIISTDINLIKKL